MEYVHRHPSPLGGITETSDGERLTGLRFDGRKYGEVTSPETVPSDGLPVFALTDRWLDLYFAGRAPDFEPPLLLRGTPFQRAVWELLRTVPYGKTATYGEIAGRIARDRGVPRMSAQAVGNAVGHNPVSLIVPCHRIVGADGSLTGYGGGLWRKERLLALEIRMI